MNNRKLIWLIYVGIIAPQLLSDKKFYNNGLN